jgi:calcineurin-like phosphoesterase family protein
MPGRKQDFFGFDIEAHDQFIVDNWNAAVGKRDTIYFMGDVGMDKGGFLTNDLIPRLKGEIHFIGGNHDTAEMARNFPYMHGVVTLTVLGKRVILTHIPIHPQEMYWDYNVHGHLHANTVKLDAINAEMGKQEGRMQDPRYICVSVEHINYTPAHLDCVIRDRTT